MPETVLVTGGTGFVAQHCVLQLLDAGYRVRATVRSVGGADLVRGAVAPYANLEPGELAERLEVVGADLAADGGWPAAVSGCRFVLHVASPVPLVMPRDEDAVIAPARDGTLRVLRAASAAGVERVVLTSSVAAVGAGRARDHVFTEEDWSDLDGPGVDAYAKSKTLAERAAWEFVASLAPSSPLSLTTICPGLILGPLLARHWGPSGEAVRRLLEGAIPGIPDLTYSPVDVRDVAAAHVTAMTAPAASGQRYLCGADAVPLRDVALVLAARYRAAGYRVPTRRLPTTLFRLAALFDRDLRLVLSEVGRPFHIDNSKIRRDLGIAFRGVEEMSLAMAESMIRLGVVADRSAGRAT